MEKEYIETMGRINGVLDEWREGKLSDRSAVNCIEAHLDRLEAVRRIANLNARVKPQPQPQPQQDNHLGAVTAD